MPYEVLIIRSFSEILHAFNLKDVLSKEYFISFYDRHSAQFKLPSDYELRGCFSSKVPSRKVRKAKSSTITVLGLEIYC